MPKTTTPKPDQGPHNEPLGSLSSPSGSPFNINEYVWVKLTDRGRAIHREQHEALNEQFPKCKLEYCPPKEDAQGWSKWQMWSLMQELGPHVGMGIEPAFETNIVIAANS
jgi:hypothetical protein